MVAEGNRIHYLEGGRGKTIVLLPSLWLTSRSYRPFGEGLEEKYHIVIPDLGRGKSSEVVISSLEEYASLLNKFLAERGINNFYLVGISFGGFIAGEFYKRYSQNLRGLILVSTTLVPVRANLLIFLGGFLRLWFRRLFGRATFAGGGLGILLSWLVDGFLSFLKHPGQFFRDAAIAIRNLDEEIKELSVPNLFLFASEDEFFYSPEVKEEVLQKTKKIRNLNLEIIKGSHTWFFLRPGDLLERVERFIDEN